LDSGFASGCPHPQLLFPLTCVLVLKALGEQLIPLSNMCNKKAFHNERHRFFHFLFEHREAARRSKSFRRPFEGIQRHISISICRHPQYAPGHGRAVSKIMQLLKTLFIAPRDRVCDATLCVTHRRVEARVQSLRAALSRVGRLIAICTQQILIVICILLRIPRIEQNEGLRAIRVGWF
jgi:hypothetical protein